MTRSNRSAGYFRSGLPYNRFGHGPCPLVVFQGLQFENKPLKGFGWFMLNMYSFLEENYTVYVVGLKPGLPDGSSMPDLADNYATMIRQEFGQPVDVIGISTGGSIALHFAADHADLVHRLVIHSSAHTLGNVAKEMQMGLARLAHQGRWRKAYTLLLGFFFPQWPGRRILVWLASRLMALGAPEDPSDLVVTVEAEDKHNFQDRLAEITAPTLVVAGVQDPTYTEALFRETAEGIPNGQLILYENMGHPAMGKQFARDVLAFLKTERIGIHQSPWLQGDNPP